MGKKALIVGIDYYDHINPLFGCVNDAIKVRDVLARHGDKQKDKNFGCRLIKVADQSDIVDRGTLKDLIRELFESKVDIALFYFAGHGDIDSTGGFLLTPEAEREDDGVALSEILDMANKSPADNKIIILDSCFSGIAGAPSSNKKMAHLSDGLTVMTASTENQSAEEEGGNGIFTSLFIDALTGAAANLVGEITPGSVYAHIDQSLGDWDQRPVFKTNVEKFVSLRKVQPSIEKKDLKRITEFFPNANFEFELDPTYEEEMRGRDKGLPLPIPENTAIFKILQKYNRLNLLIPVSAPHMWHAAMESKSCRLTALGEHYRRLVAKDRI